MTLKDSFKTFLVQPEKSQLQVQLESPELNATSRIEPKTCVHDGLKSENFNM